MANLNQKILLGLPCYAPPVGEQTRIIEAIESLLSRLDVAVESLTQAQTKLKAYRASVLKAAVEGRLVPTEAELAKAEGRSYEPADKLLERILVERRRAWEERGHGSRKTKHKTSSDSRSPDTAGLQPLPEGWIWVRLDTLSDVQLGQQRSPIHDAADEKLPYIRAANITWSGLDLSDVKSMGFPNPSRYRLKYGDVLLSEASGSPMEAGKPAIWRDEIPGACYQKTLVRVRAVSTTMVLPEFLRLAFLRDCVTGRFAKSAPGVGMVHLTAERLLAWAMPLPPVAEQTRIVEEAERLESIVDQIQALLTSRVAQCTRLRQAILKAAFEGRLVDQDPNDEPASELLARLRATPEPAPKPKRGRAPKKTS